MVTRLVITLTSEERGGLDRISMENLRDPREQLRFILRQHLEERGMLQADDQPTVNSKPVVRTKRKDDDRS